MLVQECVELPEGDGLLLHQHLGNRRVGVESVLDAQGLAQLRLGDQALLDQELAQQRLRGQLRPGPADLLTATLLALRWAQGLAVSAR